jgi:hypothetical protein
MAGFGFLKSEGRMGRSAGSGNAAWRASRRSSQCRPGNINRRRCNVVRKDGTRCHGIAVKGFPRCFHHGGSGFMILTGRIRWKLRRRIRLPRRQLKDEAQLKAEAKATAAELWDFPVGKDV